MDFNYIYEVRYTYYKHALPSHSWQKVPDLWDNYDIFSLYIYRYMHRVLS